MEYLISFRQSVLLLVLGISAITDLLYKRIYNKVLLCGFICLALTNILSGYNAEPVPAVYLLIFIIFIFTMFTRHLIGGGDVKMYIITALSFPDSTGLGIAILSIALSAAAVPVMIISGNAHPEFYRILFKLIPGHIQVERSAPSSDTGSQMYIPMALFTFISALVIFAREAVI